MSFSFWVGVVILVDEEEEEAGGVEGRGEGEIAGWAYGVTTGVPGGRGLPSRKQHTAPRELGWGDHREI